VSRDEAGAIISGKGASLIEVIDQVYHIRLPKGKEVEEAVKEFSALPQVEYAEPNYMMKMQK
jgi:hypothetical protein